MSGRVRLPSWILTHTGAYGFGELLGSNGSTSLPTKDLPPLATKRERNPSKRSRINRTANLTAESVRCQSRCVARPSWMARKDSSRLHDSTVVVYSGARSDRPNEDAGWLEHQDLVILTVISTQCDLFLQTFLSAQPLEYGTVATRDELVECRGDDNFELGTTNSAHHYNPPIR